MNYNQIINKVSGGQGFSSDLNSGLFKLRRKTVIDESTTLEAMDIDFEFSTREEFVKELERRFMCYKHSIPSRRSNNRKTWFPALPCDKLSSDDMLYGKDRLTAQAELELFIIAARKSGKAGEWGIFEDGHWFWQSDRHKDLVVMETWLNK